MTGKNMVQSPTEDQLITPVDPTLNLPGDDTVVNEKIKMKKHMGLLEGIAIILGIIFGSGDWLVVC